MRRRAGIAAAGLAVAALAGPAAAQAVDVAGAVGSAALDFCLPALERTVGLDEGKDELAPAGFRDGSRLSDAQTDYLRSQIAPGATLHSPDAAPANVILAVGSNPPSCRVMVFDAPGAEAFDSIVARMRDERTNYRIHRSDAGHTIDAVVFQAHGPGVLGIRLIMTRPNANAPVHPHGATLLVGAVLTEKE